MDKITAINASFPSRYYHPRTKYEFVNTLSYYYPKDRRKFWRMKKSQLGAILGEVRDRNSLTKIDVVV